MSLYYVIYFMIVEPYDSRFALNVEFANEILFMGVNYHFILLTDVVQDRFTRDCIGWGLIGIIGAILLINFL